MHLHADSQECLERDILLRKWTFVRYVAMGAIMLYRVLAIKQSGRDERNAGRMSHREHPKLTKWMNDSNVVLAVMIAGCIFIQSEGVGFTIYFSASALMDNFAIYFVNGGEYCQYVMQVALYSMALVTFLPTCVISYLLQGRWYERGAWVGTKTVFVVVMATATVASFLVRLFLVYGVGWNHVVRQLMDQTVYKVTIAMLVPPIVDALQTSLLIAAALKSNHSEDRQLEDAEHAQSACPRSCDKDVYYESQMHCTSSETALAPLQLGPVEGIAEGMPLLV